LKHLSKHRGTIKEQAEREYNLLSPSGKKSCDELARKMFPEVFNQSQTEQAAARQPLGEEAMRLRLEQARMASVQAQMQNPASPQLIPQSQSPASLPIQQPIPSAPVSPKL